VLAALLVVVLFPRQIDAAWGSLVAHFGNRLAIASTPAIGTLPGGSVGMLAAGPWRAIALPDPMDTVVNLAPVPYSGGAALICTIRLNKGGQQPGEQFPLLQLWRSAPDGIGWQPITSPAISANTCALSVAPDAPKRIALLAGTSADGCATEQIWLSDDGGKNWHQVLHASVVSSSTDDVSCTLWATARHLYLLTTYLQSAPGASGDAAHTIFERSNDASSWQRVPGPLGDTAWVAQSAGDIGDNVVATTASEFDHRATITVWASQDAGQTWHALASPAPLPNVLAPPIPAAQIPSPETPLYAADMGIGYMADLQEHLLQTTDGHQWNRLPALPVAGLSDGQTGIFTNVGVLGVGDLVVLGADPHHAIPADGAPLPSLWVWAWQPFAEQWDVAPAPVPGGDSTACCLDVQTSLAPDAYPVAQKTGTFLWVRTTSSAHGALYRLFLPDDTFPQGSGSDGPEPK
jgi:hypothetical protein